MSTKSKNFRLVQCNPLLLSKSRIGIKHCSMCVSLLQEPSDIDIRDEQELCESPIEHLQVRFL